MQEHKRLVLLGKLVINDPEKTDRQVNSLEMGMGRDLEVVSGGLWFICNILLNLHSLERLSFVGC